MSYDFFAQHPIRNQRDAQNLSGDFDPYARIILFAQSLLSSSDKEGIRGNEYKNELKKLGKGTTSSLLATLNLDTPTRVDLSLLPLGSFLISFKFQLARPYISRDDESFYIIDNPLAKEKVFKIPIVRPSSWKGTLRAAIRMVKAWGDNHPDLLSLFGIASGDQPNDGKRGRLHFYPTFFDDIDREVINPHDREKKAGRHPIYFECAPIGASAIFTLLYTPLDRIGKDEAETRRQVAADLELVAQGLQTLFTVYGFGAKTSSGFGLAKDDVNDARIKTNVLEAMQLAPRPAEPAMPEVLRGFLEAFPNEDFSLKPKEWRKRRGATSSQHRQYRDARSAFREYQEAQEAYKTALAEWKTHAEESGQHFLEDEFKSFNGLAKEVAGNLAERLTAGGNA